VDILGLPFPGEIVKIAAGSGTGPPTQIDLAG
jgi:hypothetical protein